ncbi:MAG: hypothetical protein FWD52_05620 [Candidatus Bathyarchaeota archaeon]|nr:hypothetical protein [Candidatus Termiticorpusculum sp.]
MEKVANDVDEKFILLNDFEASFNRFEFAKDINVSDINNKIIQPFRDEICDLLQNVENITLTDIRAQVKKHVSKRNYVVVMDDATYFQEFDYNFNITRVAYSIGHAAVGPYFRVQRDGVSRTISQVQEINDAYTCNGNQKPIILCDDGVGTGKSLRRILNMFKEIKLTVSGIHVLLNPVNLDSIKDNDINTIIKMEEKYSWLSERDLFWGLPRSGVTCSIEYEKKCFITGVPYTINNEIINSRIANFGSKTNVFRKLCLEHNVNFWTYIENELGKKMCFKDVERIKGLGCVYELFDTRVVDFLNKINAGDDGIVL